MNQMAKVSPLKKLGIEDSHEGQFLYLGRWVDKKHFRVFVYNDKGEQKLAESFNDYESLIASGIWFATKPENEVQKIDLPEIVPQGKRKIKNDVIRPNS